MATSRRKIGPMTVNSIGLGCMGLSHGYGKPAREVAVRTLESALDVGYDFIDTAALYGFGENEKLIGDVLSGHRNKFILASKCGLIRGPDGKRLLDARPNVLRQTCEDSLRNLKTDIIDLYYLHRVDPKVPLDDQIGTLGEFVNEGKVRAIGLSEVSASTIEKANAIFPISAVQSEYSLWTRNPENKVLDTCKKLGVAFVAFSPLGRGFLTGKLVDTKSLTSSDLRLSMPRFSDENLPKNLALLKDLKEISEKLSCSMAQLALAWILNRQPETLLIPGTTNIEHAKENFAAQTVSLSKFDMNLLADAFNEHTIFGERYDQVTLESMET